MSGNNSAFLDLPASLTGEFAKTHKNPELGDPRRDREVLIAYGDRLQERLGCGWTGRECLFEAWLRIRNKRGAHVPFNLNRAQRQMDERWGPRNIVLKARQLGITTYVAARFFIDTVTRPGSLSVQVAHDQDSAEEIFRIVRRFQENLPDWLRTGVLKTSRANVRQLAYPDLDSEYRVETAADPNAGRGLTINNLHCSEVARWPRDGAEVLASLRAAVPPQGQIVLESTPNGLGDVFYQEWEQADRTGYVKHFFPWWLDRSYRCAGAFVDCFSEEERNLITQVGLDQEQIAYRRQIRANFRGLAAQEFAEDPESCFLASGECVFDLEILESRLKASVDRDGDALVAESRDSGRLLIWWPAQLGRDYIIGVDPAGGGCDGDSACAQVIDRWDGRQCAELLGHFTPQELARRVADLGREYGTALVAVERNNHGHAVLAHLTAVLKYANVYAQGSQQGWLTSVASRPVMIENFAAILSLHPEWFNSPRLLRECRTFVRSADGSSRAASGSHDDCVMAMAIALAVRGDTSCDARNCRLELRGVGRG